MKPGPVTELAAQCVEAGLGTPDLWNTTGHNPSEFLELALAHFLEQRKIKSIENCIDLAMGISKVYEDTDDQYSLWMGVSACCDLMVGDAIKRLEAIQPALAVSWYKVLIESLSSAGYLFDVRDAYSQFEYMVEGAEFDSSIEDKAEYNNELGKFNPDNDIPDCILKIVNRSWSRRSVKADVRILKSFRRGTLADIIDPVLEMWRISQQPAFRNLREIVEEDDFTRIPFCTVSFFVHDSIHAAFDEFGQYAYENNSDDILWSRTLDTGRPEAFQKAIPSLDLYLSFLHAMAALHAAIEPNLPGEI